MSGAPAGSGDDHDLGGDHGGALVGAAIARKYGLKDGDR